MTRRLAIAVAVVVALASTSAPAAAQVLTPAEVERMWDTYMTSQARAVLNLNDEQFMRFTVELQALQNLRRRHQRLRNGLRAELTALIEAAGPPDSVAVEAKLRAFDDASVQAAQQVRRAYAAIDAVLTIRQRVRFRIFEERMARRKLDLLAQARAAARRGGGGGRR